MPNTYVKGHLVVKSLYGYKDTCWTNSTTWTTKVVGKKYGRRLCEALV